MERVAVLATYGLGVVVVMYTMYSVWPTLLLLGVVVAAVAWICRYVERRLEVLVPPADRVILITGCDTGIGHDTAIAASQRGLTVVAGCLDVNSPGANRLATMIGIHVLPLDVTSDDSVQSVLGQVTSLCGDKGLWAVVNNAGFNRQAPVELMSMMTFQHVADVMLFGTVRVTKAFLPLVRRAKGRVVTMSSDRGMLSPAYSAAYCIAKHGIETFSDVLRAEMTSYGVHVSVIQPGHFGGATAIINPQNMEAMQTSMELDFQECTEEVQHAYGGQRILQEIIDACVASRDYSPPDVTPIVHAILQSVLNSHPANRYPVHGMTGLFDWGIVLGQIRPVIPDLLMKIIQPIVWRA